MYTDGKVLINGYAPDGGEVNCSAITKIVVNGGPGDNDMDLSGVTRAGFPNLSDGNVEMGGGDGNDTMTGSEFGDYQNGGDGDDRQVGGVGSDWYSLFFGSADVVNDEAGDDTLDATEVTSPITIALDLQDVDQVVDAAGNTLRLEGQFENFVGSPFDDVITVGPLTVPRSIDGGSAPLTVTRSIDGAGVQAGDILNFDAQGLPVIDTGITLVVEGFAPVTYTNFATINITNVSTPTPTPTPTNAPTETPTTTPTPTPTETVMVKVYLPMLVKGLP